MPKTDKLPKVQLLDWRPNFNVVPNMGSPMGRAMGSVASPILPQTVPRRQQPITPAAQEIPTAIATTRRAVITGVGEPLNLSTTLDASRIQAAIRQAERGDTWQLFTIFRDMESGYTHLQNEFAKRKLCVVGQPHTILPKDKNSKDDKKAVAVIEEMIEHCENWDDALSHLLSATLWPVAVMEKIFAGVGVSEKGEYVNPVRFRLRKLEPISPTLFCYKIPYVSAGIGGPAYQNLGPQGLRDLGTESVAYNPNDWEPELRLYEVFANGYPDYTLLNTYALDKAVHLVHRGNNLTKTIRDNFGGHMRAIMFWWFLFTNARDWWGRYMQRWGHPFILGKVDAQQKDTLAFMQSALSMSLEIGGLVIDKNAEAELIQAASLNGAEGYKVFEEFANDEVSKVVVGQTLSSSTRSTGLGSGVAMLHGEVRQDYRQSDGRKLSTTLVKNLFTPYLRDNGYSGRVKGIIWGGKNEEQAKALSESCKNFKAAGLQPDDDGIETISERTGISFERAPEPDPAMGMPGGSQRVARSATNKPRPKAKVESK